MNWVARFLGLLMGLMAVGAGAQTNLGALARMDVAQSAFSSTRSDLALEIALSQPVPYRLALLAAPPRLVLDANSIDMAGAETLLGQGARMGSLPNGWSRLVLDMGGPFGLTSAEQRIDPATGQAVISVRLARRALEEFEAAAQSEAQFAARHGDALLHPLAAPIAPVARPRPVIMLDPGHGGLDPGAEVGGVREADLVLSFARLLRDELVIRGHFDVAMTRDADEFVSLDGRIRAARAAQADLLVSLHADTVPEGIATGAAVYLLGDEASDDTAAYLAQRHDRADMLAGVDLTRNTDDIARVLMSVAWQDTAPRSQLLAQTLVEGVRAQGLRLHRRPIQSGAFTVLRSADMPSVLVELGFMSSPRDLANLQDRAWMARMARALADGLEDWLASDRALQDLRRQ